MSADGNSWSPSDRLAHGIRKVSLSARYSDRTLRHRRQQLLTSPGHSPPSRTSAWAFARRLATHLVLKIFDLTLLFVVGLYTFQALEKYVIVPTERPFACGELRGISHAFAENSVSTKFLILQALLMPYVIIEVCEWVFVRAAVPQSSCTANVAVQMANSTIMSLKYLFGFCVKIFFMQVAKAYVGRLRPNFIAMCEPDWTKIGVDCLTAPSSTIVHDPHCQGTEHWVRQGRGSFPSGHSSVAVYMATFCILYSWEMTLLCRASESQMYKMTHNGREETSTDEEEEENRRSSREISRRTYGNVSFARRICRYMRRVLVPVVILYALIVCASRLYDRWHHPTDVLGGVFLGVLTAYMTFGRMTLAQATQARHFHV